jgi:polyhydroxyalkanoate synthesis regulator protein
MSTTPKTQPVLVKRYAGSRLYDTTNHCYVSVEQLRGWASTGVVLSVIDSETGADVTRVLLA